MSDASTSPSATVSRRRLGLAAAAFAAMGAAPSESRFTYVVVGGGAAGCVLARRLSDDDAVSVLLLEAGAAEPPAAVDMPSQWFGLSGSAIDWRFRTTPQAHADGRALPVPRGKTLGGSSVINALVHHRGVAADYDRWEALGARGWGSEVMSSMFRRSETWLGRPHPRRGTAGPIVVHPVDAPTPAALRFLEGARAAGHAVLEDVNADPGVGASLNQIAFDGRRRMSSYRAYLAPVMGRPNLTVVIGAQVLGLTFRRTRCVGVRYLKDGEVRLAGVERDLVLSAGALQSPQILMLSGLGPQAELVRYGIPVVVDLPGVGRNLHEHLIMPGLSIETRTPFPPSRLMGTDAVLYARSGAGPRDLMFNFVASATMAAGMESASSGCKTSFAYMKPRSRGRVGLASADPLAAPLIDPNVLADGEDVRGSLRGLRMARDVLNGPAFADVRVREVNPGPQATSPDDLRAFFRRTGAMFGHSVGTCRMGEDAEAVVDPHLRVRGIDNLRVADASVIPEIPAAPTNATVIALAERASDMIHRRGSAS